jgi:hypothetical protein
MKKEDGLQDGIIVNGLMFYNQLYISINMESYFASFFDDIVFRLNSGEPLEYEVSVERVSFFSTPMS